MTDFVPSEIACLDSSPGRIRRTDVWISREEIVDFLEYDASSDKNEWGSHSEMMNILEASVAIRSKISLTKLLRIAIALLEIPVSGCTCLSTAERDWHTFLSYNRSTHPCRCKKSRSPCEPSCASSCHPQHQRQRLSKSSSQPCLPQRTWRGPWKQ